MLLCANISCCTKRKRSVRLRNEEKKLFFFLQFLEEEEIKLRRIPHSGGEKNGNIFIVLFSAFHNARIENKFSPHNWK